IISRPISPSICCRSWTKPRGSGCGGIRRRATPRSAGARWKRWTPTPTPMSELERRIEAFLENLQREGASAHTVEAYASDLAQFVEYLSPPDLAPPAPRAIDHLLLRE